MAEELVHPLPNHQQVGVRMRMLQTSGDYSCLMLEWTVLMTVFYLFNFLYSHPPFVSYICLLSLIISLVSFLPILFYLTPFYFILSPPPHLSILT